jgi:methionine salvage enolase-phosphatase E1
VDGAVLIPEDNEDNTVEAVAKNVLWQMDLDRKTKALKQLQGHIMREGYKNGNLKGQ